LQLEVPVVATVPGGRHWVARAVSAGRAPDSPVGCRACRPGPAGNARGRHIAPCREDDSRPLRKSGWVGIFPELRNIRFLVPSLGMLTCCAAYESLQTCLLCVLPTCPTGSGVLPGHIHLRRAGADISGGYPADIHRHGCEHWQLPTCWT
jgi:hypothetical protein